MLQIPNFLWIFPKLDGINDNNNPNSKNLVININPTR